MPTTTPFQNLITFSRGSNATVTGPNGLIQWAPNNLVTHSEQIDNAAWTKGNITVVANVAAAPDGTSTADRLVPSSVNTFKFANGTPSFSTGAGQGATYSCYAKADGYSKIALRESATTGAYASFDLATASVIETGNAGGMVVSNASVTDVGNGWYRLAMTCTNPTSTGVHGFGAWPLSPSYTTGQPASLSWSGNGTSGILIWGAQLELGSTATTYNPTTVKNLLGFSEAFDNAAWTKNAASIVTGAAANPVNGLFNAQKLMEDTTTGEHRITQTVALVSGTTYTFSLYVKAAGRTAISFYGAGGLAALAGTVNLVTGATINGSASAVDVGNGWWRISGSGTSTFTGANSITVRLFSASGTYAGNGSDGVFIYGAQLSDSASLDPYVPTPGAAPSSTAYYGPRFDYDPVNRQPKGILIEEQRTNLLTYSEQFDNAAWTKLGGAITANATLAPDGAVTADQLIEDASTGLHIVYRAMSFTSGTAYALSFWVKRGSGTRNAAARLDDGVSTRRSIINLATGAVTPAVGHTVTTRAWGAYWYVTCTVTAAATASAVVGVEMVDGSNPTYTGDGASSIDIWGAQLEAGAFATSYIPTIASTVTRSADSLFLSGQNFAQWYRQDAGAWYAEFNVLDQAGVTYTVSDGTGNNRFIGYPASSVQLEITTGGVLQASLDGGTITPNTNVKVASAYATNDAALSLNGGTAVSDASVTLPTVNQSRIGANVGGGNLLNGHIRSIGYIPVRAADFQLQALTT